jgi:hypothetical protein
VTEIELLRRRRELVLLSAQLQRATVVRRLDHIERHPAQAVFALASSAASVPLLWKLGTSLLRATGLKRPAPHAPKRGWSRKLLSLLKFLPVLKLFPVPKFFHR